MPEALRVLIVDDEAPARDLLQILCAEERLEVVGEAADGLTALARVEALAPDLVLLDVAMPGLDGMGVAMRLAERGGGPWVVFTTAYTRYAAAAFDVAAVDYLLKPVTPARFRQAIARVPVSRSPSRPQAGHLWLPHLSDLVRADLSDITRVDAERDYVRIALGGRTHLLRTTMDSFAARLPEALFLRLHRSTLVRRDQIAGLRHEGGGVWSVTLPDGSLARIGRSYLAAVHALVG